MSNYARIRTKEEINESLLKRKLINKYGYWTGNIIQPDNLDRYDETVFAKQLRRQLNKRMKKLGLVIKHKEKMKTIRKKKDWPITHNEIKINWSISTIKIYLENTNESKAFELLNNKKYLTQLVTDLKSDHTMMWKDFGDSDETVKEYFVAINDIKDWINVL